MDDEDNIIMPPKPHRTAMAMPTTSGDCGAICYMPLPTSGPTGTRPACSTPQHKLPGSNNRPTPIILATPPMPPHNKTDLMLPLESGDNTLEGILVEKALRDIVSLPEAVTEVASKNKYQQEELNRQKVILLEIQEKLTGENHKHDNMSTERASIKRRTYLAEESTLSKVEKCSRLKKDVIDMAVRAAHLRAQMTALTKQVTDDKLCYKQYREKMTSHEQLVAESERGRPIRVQLNELTEAVEKLERRERALTTDAAGAQRLSDGDEERELQATLTRLEDRHAHTHGSLKARREVLKKEKEHRQRTKQEIDVLCKRNAAQLTRLRAQMREAQVRNRHWGEQAAELEQGIATLQQQLVT